MLVKTKALVLKTMKFQDSGIICHLYTEELGLRSYVVSGVYSKKGKSKIAYFHPLSQLNVVVYEKENKDLQRIKEFELNKIYQAIPFDFLKGSMALFVAEILQNALKEKTGNSDLYFFLESWVDRLEHSNTNELSHFPLVFLAKLSDLLGFGQAEFNGNQTSFFDLREGVFVQQQPFHQDYMDEELTACFVKILACDGQLNTIHLERIQRNLLLEQLLRYYSLHIDHFKTLKTIPIISKILR